MFILSSTFKSHILSILFRPLHHRISASPPGIYDHPTKMHYETQIIKSKKGKKGKNEEKIL